MQHPLSLEGEGQLDKPAVTQSFPRGGNPEERSFAPFVQRRGRGSEATAGDAHSHNHPSAQTSFPRTPPVIPFAPSRHSRAGGNLPSATSPLPRWERVRVRVNSPTNPRTPPTLSTSPRDRRPGRERSTPGAGRVCLRSIFPLPFPLSDHVHEVD